MNMSSSNHLVINSKEDIMLLQLSSYGRLEYSFLDNTYKPITPPKLYKDDVLKYALTVDKSENLHLITLMKTGELNYSIYKNHRWTDTLIAKFDFNSRIYNTFEILILDEEIHIIYDYANLVNSKLFTIQHVVSKGNSWKQRSITKYILTNGMESFAIDSSHSGIIHLLHSSIEGGGSHIYYTFYNPYANKWNSRPQRLTSQKSSGFRPYILSDTNDNVHALWLDKVEDDYVLKYSRLGSTGKQKYMWKPVNIPYIPNCSDSPIIYEEENVLKIVYATRSGIGYIYSLDGGNTWIKGSKLDIDPSKINTMRISMPFSGAQSNRINRLYYTVDKQLKFFFLDTFNSSDTPTTEDASDILSEKTDLVELLDQILLSQEIMDEKIDFILKILKKEKRSFFDKFLG